MSVLNGSGELIDSFLDCAEVGKRPYYRHRRSMKLLCGRCPEHPMGESLISQLGRLVGHNHEAAASTYGRNSSKQNWRFTQRVEISSANTSPEVTLERELVRQMAPEFANQVPTASGLAGLSVDKTRNVDLVRDLGDSGYEFIELKVGSDTPVMAAFEIYGNAAIYTYYRAEIGPNGGTGDQPILSASHVGLRTLAPQRYYHGLDLAWLETLLNKDLELYRAEQGGRSVLSDFAFLTFPRGFEWPQDGEAGEGQMSVRKAVSGIQKLYR